VFVFIQTSPIIGHCERFAKWGSRRQLRRLSRRPFAGAGLRAEALAQDADDQGERLAVLLERLLRNQFLRLANAECRMALPIDDLKFNPFGRRMLKVVIAKELADKLAVFVHVSGRRQENVVPPDGGWFQFAIGHITLLG
jgi:hypothetical protein